ncbi:MAG: ABC transporter permease [Acidocella sp.]|nr:ABC transporter permease [Acidocella sp.]
MNFNFRQAAPSAAMADPAVVQAEHLLIYAGQSWRERGAMAFADLSKTLALWRLVWALSVFDIKLRYRGSILGPFWLTISTGMMVFALGFLYSELFHIELTTYLPFISLSLVLWTFISCLVAEGCTCFTTQEAMLRAMRMPLSMHAARVVVRNVFVLLHNILVIVLVFFILRIMPGKFSFLLIPGFALWLVDGFAICLILGVLCTRYRDVPPIVASVMQIAFFITPVIWSPAILQHRGRVFLETWNPFFDLLDIVRAPLLSTPISPAIWGIAVFYSVILVIAAGLVFIQSRARVAYWV